MTAGKKEIKKEDRSELNYNMKLSMRLKYCRKIFASFLRQQGVQPEIIDILQGRITKNIFLR